MRPQLADSIGPAVGLGCIKRPDTMTASDLCAARQVIALPGGGHPHMRRREFITLLGGCGDVAASRARAAAGDAGGRFPQRASPGTHRRDRRRAFRQGLKDSGYVEGENVAIDIPLGGGSMGSTAGIGGRTGSPTGSP